MIFDGIDEEKSVDGGGEVEVAEWSKAVDLGSIPKGRGFKPHLLHFLVDGWKLVNLIEYKVKIT